MKVRLSAIYLFISVLVTGGQVAGAALQDPTRPYLYDNMVQISKYSPDEDIEWKLSGVKFREGIRTAILNGKLVREGDDFGSATVLEIKPSEVILLYEHKRVAVKLLISNIKRPVFGNSKR